MEYLTAVPRNGLPPQPFGESSMADLKPTPARNSQTSCRPGVASVGTGWGAPITPSESSIF